METLPTAPATDEVSAYVALVRRRWRIVAAGIVAGLVLPGLYVLLGPKTYTATTSVLVKATGVEEPAEVAGSTGDATINLDTQAEVATSIVVATQARKSLGISTPPDELLDNHVEVDVPPNSAVLAISYDAGAPEAARAGAQAFAKAYLSNRRQSAEAQVHQRATALRKKIQKLNGHLDSVTRKLSTLSPGSADHSYARQRQNLLTNRISTLNATLGTLSTQTVTPGRIISAAQPPTSPSSPIIPLYLAGGVILGALVGVGAAVLRDRGDARVRHASDVERLVRLPVLLEVPGKPQQSEPGLLAPRSGAGQAFHGLSHSIGAALGHGNHVVLVTGASQGPATSVVATNLAATLARTGSPTVLACADMQSVTSPWMLGLQPSPGLSDILLHGTRASAVEQRPAEPSRLRVIASGLDTDVASEQLQTQAMERLVGELRSSASYIVVEAPSTATSADAQALADLADLTLVVVDVPRTEREEIREGVRRLDRVGAAILGAVVVPSLAEPSSLRKSEHLAGSGQPGQERRPETAPMPVIRSGTAQPAGGGSGGRPAGEGTPNGNAARWPAGNPPTADGPRDRGAQPESQPESGAQAALPRWTRGGATPAHTSEKPAQAEPRTADDRAAEASHEPEQPRHSDAGREGTSGTKPPTSSGPTGASPGRGNTRTPGSTRSPH